MTETVPRYRHGRSRGNHPSPSRSQAPMLQPTTRANAHIQSQSLLGGSAPSCGWFATNHQVSAGGTCSGPNGIRASRVRGVDAAVRRFPAANAPGSTPRRTGLRQLVEAARASRLRQPRRPTSGVTLGTLWICGSVTKTEIKTQTEYALREKRSPGTPFQRVRVVEHILILLLLPQPTWAGNSRV